MGTQRKIRHDSISDMVYKSLFDDIVNGKLRPGQRITELEISDSRGISRAPVREAIARLATDGLVRLVPRSGCYVCELTEEDINHIFDIRYRLEDLCLEYAFDNIDRAGLAKLREKFIECLEFDDQKMIREEIRLDSMLHNSLLSASGSENLQDVLGRLLARVHVFRSIGSKDITRLKVAIKKHIAILEAIIDNNLEKTKKLLFEHIQRSREDTLARADFFKQKQ